MAKAKLHIENNIYVEFDIEDQDIPPIKNMYDKILISESVGSPIPTLECELYDQAEAMSDDFAINDGSLITFTMGPSESKLGRPRKFRSVGTRTTETASGPMFIYTSLFDVPKFSQANFVESYEGTSASVMGQIASQAGLQYDGPGSTSDKQVWINMGLNRLSFTEDICMHGYAGASSCMMRSVTSTGVLVYKNVFEVLQGTAKAKFVLNGKPDADNAFAVRETKDFSVSGVMNSWINYGLSVFEHSMTGKQKKYGKVQAPKFGPYLPINSDVKGQVENSKIEYIPTFDAGNVHEKYNEAYYQNLRFLALHGERLAVIVEDMTSVELLDVVEFQHVNALEESVKRTNGKYITVGKKIMIKNGIRYSEMLILARPYVNVKGKSNLT